MENSDGDGSTGMESGVTDLQSSDYDRGVISHSFQFGMYTFLLQLTVLL
jgi:hypothetical protein